MAMTWATSSAWCDRADRKVSSRTIGHSDLGVAKSQVTQRTTCRSERASDPDKSSFRDVDEPPLDRSWSTVAVIRP